MILDWNIVEPTLSEEIRKAVQDQIAHAFDFDGDNYFEVNSREFYRKTNSGLNRAVTNQADFISIGFQNRLVAQGWTKEKTLIHQKFDGYKEFNLLKVDTVSISLENYKRLINDSNPLSADYIKSVKRLYHMYLLRKVFCLPTGYDPSLFTVHNNEDRVIRIGLEFETGNIASSFRSIAKLNILYYKDLIDVGVLITSRDKKTATTIWPSTNRNGSIEELNQRLFENVIDFPCMILGFAPDKWSDEAGFLKKDGTRWSLSSETETMIIKERSYTYYTNEGFYEKRVEKGLFDS